jgi:TolB protein
LRVEITGVGSQQFPISIAPFARDGLVPVELDAVIRANLARSGMFRVVESPAAALAENSPVNYADWRGRGADALVIGSASRLADGRFDVRYRLLDTVQQGQLDGLSYVAPAADLRLTAHRIADRIYERITGERGVFATRIAYVVQTARNAWELHIADADGANSQAALRSREPIISPAWSPDGARLAYVSFESGKPVVYVHAVATGERRAVANFRGSNSAPAWSPDGRALAVTLTREGNSQIFVMGADGSNVRRLTTSAGIDTEPVFAPDGTTIFFTSDRGGGPQIYRMPAAGGPAQRVTFNGRLQHQPAAESRMGGCSPMWRAARAVSRFMCLIWQVARKRRSPTPRATNRPVLRPMAGCCCMRPKSTVAAFWPRRRLTVVCARDCPGPTGDIREPTWGPFIK